MLLRKMPCDMTAVVDHGCSGDVSYLTGERAVKKTSILATHNRRAGCSNQAKNSVTSRARLDEKYYDRRALTKLANQKPQFERIFGVFLQRDARLESSSPEIPLAQIPTLRQGKSYQRSGAHSKQAFQGVDTAQAAMKLIVASKLSI